MLLEMLNKLHCHFNQVIQEKKKELQSKNEGLWCFSHILRKLLHSSAVVQFYLFSVFHMKLFENVLYWP